VIARRRALPDDDGDSAMEATMSRWMQLLSFARKQPVRRVARPPRSAPEADDGAPPRGCAWFDSSHELRCGLVVLELEVISCVITGECRSSLKVNGLRPAP
jgi:hypothetical protein